MEPISIRAVEQGVRQIEGAPKGAQGSFGDELTKAIGKVEDLQQQGDVEATKLAHGAGNLHEVAMALEKADLAMRVATRVRNKLVEAYQEVMRMSV